MRVPHEAARQSSTHRMQGDFFYLISTTASQYRLYNNDGQRTVKIRP